MTQLLPIRAVVQTIQYTEKMSQHNQYAKAVTNAIDSDYPDVQGSMMRRGAYNKQNHSMPLPRGRHLLRVEHDLSHIHLV